MLSPRCAWKARCHARLQGHLHRCGDRYANPGCGPPTRLAPGEVASREQPYEAPALESDRLDGLVKLREQMMQALPRPQPEPVPEPPLQEVTLGSMPDAASGPSSAHAKAGDDLI